ncbi:MAG: TIGR02300 family protein [Proteobacteria bacterium]|nr:TIGR02300 family protein [Pseudomonadota bacterium]
MAKPEWGLKRVCQSCGARFYDLARSPIHCPKCGAEFDPEVLVKNKRSKAPPAPPRPVPKPVPEVEEIEPAADEPVVAEDADEAEKEEDAVIEDTTELGGDEDVTEVIENVDKDEER